MDEFTNILLKANNAFETMRDAINEVEECMQAATVAMLLDYWTAERGTTMKEFCEILIETNAAVEAQCGKISVEDYERSIEEQT